MVERTPTLLVVDDNPATLYATTRVLRHAGFEVLEASTGTRAIQQATSEPVDLVVLDIDLPDLNGYQVCREIRSNPATRRVRVLYLSATFVDDTARIEGFEAGADGYLTHPVEPAVLHASVAALLRTRAIELELEDVATRERAAREEAEQANRAKDDFLATLSHELRSPLTAIVGWSEVARMHAQGHEPILAALGVITRNAHLQAQLISDLLDVSRLTAGKGLDLDVAPVSLRDIVRECVDSAQAMATAEGVHLEARIDEGVVLVLGDAGRLHQIVTNLLTNAIKFTDPGRTVRVTLAAGESQATIDVQDEGIGISPGVLPRIFDRFWQQDNSTRRVHGGLGLGLSIVKRLTELHGGTVSAASAGEGHGAQFRVVLPLVRNDSMVPGDAEDANAGMDIRLDGVRVLLVDDDDDARRWMAHVIAAHGAETWEASGVDEALAAVAATRPHLIISDLAMPRRNGFDLAHAVRAAGHSPDRMPMIALSALASTADERKALDADFQYFLAKPPDPRQLLMLVWRATRQSPP